MHYFLIPHDFGGKSSILSGCYLDKREKCNEYNKEQVSQYNENKKSENGIKMVTGPFITMHMKRHHGLLKSIMFF